MDTLVFRPSMGEIIGNNGHYPPIVGLGVQDGKYPGRSAATRNRRVV
jgi:hypothetical protein